MPFEGQPLVLTPPQRVELEEIGRSQSLPAGFVLRAKILLLLAEGVSYQAVADKLDTSTPTVGKWKKRFLRAGFDGLETHRPGQAPSKLTPRLRELHIILDNLSAHKTRKVAAFLEAHPNVQLHFTPTYSSWLNQVQLWFSKLQRDVIARGVFTSTADLARKLRRYINAYSKNAKPFRWKYSHPSRRIPYAKTSSKTVN